MDSYPVIGERLKAAREAKGWTPLRLSMEVAQHGKLVRDTDINRWERLKPDGKEMDLRASNLRALCLALGISSDYVLGLTDDPTTAEPAEPPANGRAGPLLSGDTGLDRRVGRDRRRRGGADRRPQAPPRGRSQDEEPPA